MSPEERGAQGGAITASGIAKSCCGRHGTILSGRRGGMSATLAFHRGGAGHVGVPPQSPSLAIGVAWVHLHLPWGGMRRGGLQTLLWLCFAVITSHLEAMLAASSDLVGCYRPG